MRETSLLQKTNSPRTKLLSGKEAMDAAEIEIPGLKARDGLAVINGSNLLTAMSAIYIYKLRRNTYLEI